MGGFGSFGGSRRHEKRPDNQAFWLVCHVAFDRLTAPKTGLKMGWLRHEKRSEKAALERSSGFALGPEAVWFVVVRFASVTLRATGGSPVGKAGQPNPMRV